MAKTITRSRPKPKGASTKSRGGKMAKVSTVKYKSRGGRMTASKTRVVGAVSGGGRTTSNQGPIVTREFSGEDAADYLLAVRARSRAKGAHLSMAEVHERIS